MIGAVFKIRCPKNWVGSLKQGITAPIRFLDCKPEGDGGRGLVQIDARGEQLERTIAAIRAHPSICGVDITTYKEGGGCMGVVNILKQNNVDAILVGGIGMRPMMGFQQVGIKVYAGADGTVEFIVNEFIEGRLRQAGDEVICGHSREPAHEHGPGCHHGH